MNTFDKFKLQILELIKSEEYDKNDLSIFLDIEFFEDPIFMEETKKIVEIIIYDRNNNLRFDIDDIRLISTDPLAITSLISSIFIIIAQIAKLKYHEGTAEELAIKLLCYIFLVLLPKEANLTLTFDQKNEIINICFDILKFLEASKIVKHIFEKIKKWLKSKCMKSNDKISILNKKLLKSKTDLHSSMSMITIERKL